MVYCLCTCVSYSHPTSRICFYVSPSGCSPSGWSSGSPSGCPSGSVGSSWPEWNGTCTQQVYCIQGPGWFPCLSAGVSIWVLHTCTVSHQLCTVELWNWNFRTRNHLKESCWLMHILFHHCRSTWYRLYVNPLPANDTHVAPWTLHKPTGIYMEDLILGGTLQYMVSASFSCFFNDC